MNGSKPSGTEPPRQYRARARHEFTLGRVLGIRISVDVSWIFIFVLVTWNLTLAFGSWHRDWTLGLSLSLAFIAAVLFFASVLIHELAHSLVARAFGMHVHSIMLFMFGGVSNLEHEPDSPRVEFLTAVVGPLASFALGLVFSVIGVAASHISPAAAASPRAVATTLGPIPTLFLWLGPINILLGLFNLIPGFPLDGGRLLRSILWRTTGDLTKATRVAARIGAGIGWAMILLGVVMAFGVFVPFVGGGFVSGLWLAAIGWFLKTAAAQSEREQALRAQLEGLRVGSVMEHPPTAVPAEAPISVFVHDWLQVTRAPVFPVASDGAFAGLVTRDDVARVARADWGATTVGQVMTPVNRLTAVSPQDELKATLPKFAHAETGCLAVMWGPRLMGLLNPADIARAVMTRFGDGRPPPFPDNWSGT